MEIGRETSYLSFTIKFSRAGCIKYFILSKMLNIISRNSQLTEILVYYIVSYSFFSCPIFDKKLVLQAEEKIFIFFLTFYQYHYVSDI